MMSSDEGGEFRWAAKFPKDDPWHFSNDRVKCFGEVDEDWVEAHVLFSPFLLNLSDCKLRSCRLCCGYGEIHTATQLDSFLQQMIRSA